MWYELLVCFVELSTCVWFGGKTKVAIFGSNNFVPDDISQHCLKTKFPFAFFVLYNRQSLSRTSYLPRRNAQFWWMHQVHHIGGLSQPIISWRNTIVHFSFTLLPHNILCHWWTHCLYLSGYSRVGVEVQLLLPGLWEVAESHGLRTKTDVGNIHYKEDTDKKKNNKKMYKVKI